MGTDYLRFLPITAVIALAIYSHWSTSAPSPGFANQPSPVAKDRRKPSEDEIGLRPSRNPFYRQVGLAQPTEPGPAGRPSAEEPEVSRLHIQDLLATLSLNGTLIGGGERLALINGRFYRQGESIAADGNQACVVHEIEQSRVMLKVGAESFALQYAAAVARDPIVAPPGVKPVVERVEVREPADAGMSRLPEAADE